MNLTTKQRTAVNAYIEKLILPSDPLAPLWNRESIMFGKPPKWNYIDGCMIRALIMYGEFTSDSRLTGYAERFTDAYVTDSGRIPTLNYEDFNLDNICGGRNLLWLWRNTGSRKYLAAAERLFSGQLERQPRTPSGSFWHKKIYPDQIWLDGVYMALPFMAEYARLTGNGSITADISAQLGTIKEKMRDRTSGLYYHGYDESRRADWADRETGLSQEFWLRSMGWLCAGLADICETVPGIADDMLCDLLEALTDCVQSGGMLLQLPNRPELEGNYPETSGTLLYAYAAMKAARLGTAGDRVRSAGIRGFEAVSEKYISFDGDGMPVLGNICLMAGLGGEQRRDGSAGYYLSEPVTENDAKGIAPYLMACTEYQRSEIKS